MLCTQHPNNLVRNSTRRLSLTCKAHHDGSSSSGATCLPRCFSSQPILPLHHMFLLCTSRGTRNYFAKTNSRSYHYSKTPRTISEQLKQTLTLIIMYRPFALFATSARSSARGCQVCNRKGRRVSWDAAFQFSFFFSTIRPPPLLYPFPPLSCRLQLRTPQARDTYMISTIK